MLGLLNQKSDPTYTSGLNYAQSIAGGENVPNMIAPGMSYSAAMPQGYTQADLNVPVVSTVPAIPDDSSFLPGGDAVNPPDYSQLPDNVIGGGRGDNITFLDDLRFPPPQDILGKYRPLDLSGIQSILDSFKTITKPTNKEKISVPDVPVVPPLEDYGFGPGIMPPLPDDFFIEEEMMPPMPPMEDINILEIPDIPPIIPPMIPNGSTFSIEQPRYSLLR
tara:strand:- start:1214 stop:1873 length:660 start_codon:yes stop_codon:yes gene_type:complete